MPSSLTQSVGASTNTSAFFTWNRLAKGSSLKAIHPCKVHRLQLARDRRAARVRSKVSGSVARSMKAGRKQHVSKRARRLLFFSLLARAPISSASSRSSSRSCSCSSSCLRSLSRSCSCGCLYRLKPTSLNVQNGMDATPPQRISLFLRYS